MPMPNLPAPSGDHPDFVKFDSPGTAHTVRVDEVWSFTSKPYPGTTQTPSEVFAISGPAPDGTPISISVGGTGSRHSLYRQFHAGVVDGTIKTEAGVWVRVTFTAYDGQAKLFQLDVAPAGAIPDPPNAPAPVPAPVLPAPTQSPTGFPPADAFGQAPAAPAPW